MLRAHLVRTLGLRSGAMRGGRPLRRARALTSAPALSRGASSTAKGSKARPGRRRPRACTAQSPARARWQIRHTSRRSYCLASCARHRATQWKGSRLQRAKPAPKWEQRLQSTGRHMRNRNRARLAATHPSSTSTPSIARRGRRRRSICVCRTVPLLRAQLGYASLSFFVDARYFDSKLNSSGLSVSLVLV